MRRSLVAIAVLAPFFAACTTDAPPGIRPEEKLCRELSALGCHSHLSVKSVPPAERMTILLSVGAWLSNSSREEDLFRAADFVELSTRIYGESHQAHARMGSIRLGMAEYYASSGLEGAGAFSDALLIQAANEYLKAIDLEPDEPDYYRQAILAFSMGSQCEHATTVRNAYRRRFGEADTLDAWGLAYEDKCAGKDL